jgi:hypothetical protein
MHEKKSGYEKKTNKSGSVTRRTINHRQLNEDSPTTPPKVLAGVVLSDSHLFFIFLVVFFCAPTKTDRTRNLAPGKNAHNP